MKKERSFGSQGNQSSPYAAVKGTDEALIPLSVLDLWLILVDRGWCRDGSSGALQDGLGLIGH